MKNFPPSHGQRQSPALSPATNAERCRQALLEAANVLKGAAIQMDAGGETRIDLLISAGYTLANTFVRGLIAPQDVGACDASDAKLMIEQLQAWLVGPKVEESEVVYIPAECKPSRPRDVELNELTWSWQIQKIKLEEMELTVLRDGDPTGPIGDDHQRIAIEILRDTWETLCATHPEWLSPEVALIKNEVLPGIDPWLNQARDFRKAAWVCETAAKLIEQRCDFRNIDAAKASGIPKGTITRACQAGHIKTNGKTFGKLRMNRSSFESWERAYQARKGRSKRQLKASLPKNEVKCECNQCGAGFPNSINRCPKCHSSQIRLAKSPVPRRG